MSNIKACIFDLDGTLINTINAIAHLVSTCGIRFARNSGRDYKIYVGDGRDKLIHRMLGVYGKDNAEMFEKCDVYDENYENDYLYDTDAYDGIRELLEELKENGIKIAVCSNKPDNVVHLLPIIFSVKIILTRCMELLMVCRQNPTFTALEIAKNSV